MPKREISFFYLAYYGFEKTVIESQVLTPLRHLSHGGIRPRVLFFENLSRWLRGPTPDQLLSLRGLDAKFLPRVPRNFLGLDTILLSLFLLPKLLSGRHVVLHARGLQGTAVASPLRRLFPRLRLICDVRGIESEEYRYQAGGAAGKPLPFARNLWWRKLMALERRALDAADAVFCVSRAMLEFLKGASRPSAARTWDYVPCAVDTRPFVEALQSRESTRTRMNLTDRLVVVYAGSAAAWQIPDTVVAVFKQMKAIDARCFLQVITPDVQAFTSRLEAAGVGPIDGRVEKVEFSRVPEVLAAGDIGLLLRETSPVNLYSCPTKFAEYLSAGLHVVTTKAIADVASLVTHRSVGTALDLGYAPGVAADLKKAIEAAQDVSGRTARSIAAAREFFDWSVYIPIIRNRYLQLTEIA